MVDPDAFVAAMERRWRDYGNVTSPALRAMWHQIVAAFNSQIATPRLPRPVLAAELGAGKTTSVKQYAALLTDRASHPGVLIVVRLQEQAEEMARDINMWAGAPAGAPLAFAFHSALRPQPKLDNLAQYPVVCICHAAYENSLDSKADETDERYEKFLSWRGGTRGLCVVDEALDHVKVARLPKYELQRMVGGTIPGDILRDHKVARRVLMSALEILLDAPEHHRVVPIDAMLAGAGGIDAEEADDVLAKLWQAVRGSNKVKPDTKRHDGQVLDAPGVRRRIGEMLAALRRQIRLYRWTDGDKAAPAIVSSRLMLPPTAGVVILDATGSLNTVYRGLKKEFDVATLPVVRNYDAVTLYAARVAGTGKRAVENAPKKYAQETLDAVLAHYGPRASSRQVLVITSKDSERSVHEVWSKAGFAALEVAHWGAIDGKNSWRAFDTLVTVSLNWTRPSTDILTYMAVHGVELNDHGLNAPPDEVRVYREARVAAELTQAIGRIRLRKMTSEDGRCQPSDIFVRVPKEQHRLADPEAIVANVVKALRGIQVRTWAELDEPLTRTREPKVTNEVVGALVAYAASMPQDSGAPAEDVRRAIGAVHMTWYKVRRRALTPGDPVHQALAAVGCRIVPQQRSKGKGMGRGSGYAYLARGAWAPGLTPPGTASPVNVYTPAPVLIPSILG